MVVDQRRELRCKSRSVVGARVLEAEKLKSFRSAALAPTRSTIEPGSAASPLDRHRPAQREGQIYRHDDVIGGQNSQLGSPRFLDHTPRRAVLLSGSRLRGIQSMRVE